MINRTRSVLSFIVFDYFEVFKVVYCSSRTQRKKPTKETLWIFVLAVLRLQETVTETMTKYAIEDNVRAL